ncbi:MAG: GGDEF domain-containing protein [Nocardioidaceae bacterium]|nr:GGDEF domain-containing protein [Nocardioidaceae bacterium]
MNHALARLVSLATEIVDPRVAARALADAADGVLGVDGVGVALHGAAGHRSVHATTEPAHVLERLQDERTTGPRAQADRSGADVAAWGDAGLAVWPHLADTARTVGIGCVTVMPLVSRGRCWGVLSLYTSNPEPVAPDVLEAARILADVTTSLLVKAADGQAARDAKIDVLRRASRDPLTGASSRLVLSARLDQALHESRRRGTTTGVLFVDVDDFRGVRRTHGPAAGDEVLRETARRIGAQLRRSDTLARLADDEFVVVCCDLAGTVDDPDGPLRTVVDRIRRAMLPAVRTAAGDVVVSLSIGEAVSTGTDLGAHLIDEADRSMYRSRASRADG